MSRRPASLWVEIVLALSLLTLVTIVLNAGVFWLILKQAEEERRTDLAEALVDGMVAQLGAGAQGPESAPGPRPADILSAYKASSVGFDALFVVAADGTPLHVVAGTPPEELDRGLRVALFGRERDVRVEGAVWAERAVVVTAPVVLRGASGAALRVRLPLASPSVLGSPSAFILAYTTSTGVLIAVFGFSLFRRRLLAPIAELREGTQRIADGEFGHAVTVDAALELQALCDALNTMSTDLASFRTRTDEQMERLRQANLELQATQSALVRSERLAGVGRLAAGLAHEIGNPLAAVLGFVEFLEQPLDDPDLQADLLRRSRLELERIHRIIRALLDYSRQGSGEAEVVPVVEAVREAIGLVRHVPRVRTVDFVLEPPPEPPPCVVIERDQLHQVVVNVLLNAGDAALHEGVPRVSVSIHPTDQTVRIRVRDSGAGFGPEALERALEPFFTTKEPGQGTGLGLATTAQVVEGAGGQILLANHPQGGAVVDVVLPLAESP